MLFENCNRNGTILAILNPCDASHQVLARSDIQFARRCRLKNFKMAAMAIILDIGTERSDFRKSESLCHCDTSHKASA